MQIRTRAKTEVALRPRRWHTTGLPASTERAVSHPHAHRFWFSLPMEILSVEFSSAILVSSDVISACLSGRFAARSYFRVNPDIWSPALFPDECTAIKVLVLHVHIGWNSCEFALLWGLQ